MPFSGCGGTYESNVRPLDSSMVLVVAERGMSQLEHGSSKHMSTTRKARGLEVVEAYIARWHLVRKPSIVASGESSKITASV